MVLDKKALRPAVILDRLFRKTMLLKPTHEKVFEAINITGKVDSIVYKDTTGAIEMNPYLIVPVRGLKNVRQICIQKYNTPMLLNAFDTEQTYNGLSEKTLADMLETSEAAGRLQGDKEPDKMKNMMWVVIGLAALAVMLSIVMYSKLKAMGG